jgi:hypothetical protein
MKMKKIFETKVTICAFKTVTVNKDVWTEQIIECPYEVNILVYLTEDENKNYCIHKEENNEGEIIRKIVSIYLSSESRTLGLDLSERIFDLANLSTRSRFKKRQPIAQLRNYRAMMEKLLPLVIKLEKGEY